MVTADGNFDTLRQIVAQLRAPDGCPWDRAQTHESLKPTCIEEAAEVICGINILGETGNADNLKEELGDLLLQVMFHAQLAEEEGLFTIEDVIEGVCSKMIRRHPHVFGEEAARAAMRELAAERGGDQDDILKAASSASGTEEVVSGWEEIKKLEKQGREWEKDYLPEALDESGRLLARARRRKFPEQENATEQETAPDRQEMAGRRD